MIDNITKNIIQMIKLNKYEECIIKKLFYGYKLNKYEKIKFDYIIKFKIPTIKLLRRIKND